MNDIDFNQPQKVFFIGIGGISMSGLAEILKHNNFIVYGSDIKSSNITDKLESLGVKVFIGHNATNITDDLDLVIHTAAIKPDNPEYQEALKKEIPLIDRAQLLSTIMDNYKYSLAVSGTHGKTTTTSMISHILLEGEKDPTISVGGILNVIKGNIRVGESDFFVTEACEYYNSFLKLNPYMGIVLNMEEDHLDFFEDIKAISDSFNQFAKKIPTDGFLIVNGDIELYNDLVKDVPCHILTFGSNNTQYDYCANNITFNSMAQGSFDLYIKGDKVTTIQLEVTGMHNVYNALAAIASTCELGMTLDVIQKGLSTFEGTQRRFEYKGNVAGITIIDDYAHHPTEISATLSAAKNYPHNNIWCVFQPHTYTRTKAFLKDFAISLSLADKVIVTDIYAAREINHCDIHSKDLLNELEKLGKESYYISSFDEIETFLLQNCVNKDLLITMGAGNVNIIGEELLGE
ncbi:UDP-N-acetylmuramate--L-alanine ligase [Natranaerovirga hydrolytica]|uniref:UDP-N-acetylmuramate--L-alanine ligase n=1 Tax=Natranaerovirga hydrolytica TaxID=680378 RepID=A0A4V2PZ03_9FIRM|nr:UDP-N-acetylmuramate--L-alanine ligase [Natranaerovirga hydrolytica]TCK87881.1 UDP-N-acetylmuramate--L-alanine ligase [Natranaerovirga hydrolytica]